MPYIGSSDIVLLTKLEELLKSEVYSNVWDDTVSSIIDKILEKTPILEKTQIFKLMALLNTLSDKSTINYSLNLETQPINLSQLIQMISESNESEAERKKAILDKEIGLQRDEQFSKAIHNLLLFIVGMIVFICIIPLVLELLAFLWDSFKMIVYYALLIGFFLIFGLFIGRRR